MRAARWSPARRVEEVTIRHTTLPKEAQDALHRQINIAHGSGLFFRKNEQTASEGTRHASPSHAMQPAPSERRTRRSVLLRSEDPVQKSCTADECCAPRFCAGLLAGRPACVNDGHFARRRPLCSRCTPLVSEPRLPAFSHASEHGMLMLT